MSRPVSRRGFLSTAASVAGATATGGWLWQGTSAAAATPPDGPVKAGPLDTVILGDRLPTNWSARDFVFSDEEDGVVAVKNGNELLYASLYWRARQAVNGYARIHHVTPTDQRSATIRQRSTVRKAGDFAVRDWVLWDYAINDPGAAHLPPGGFPPPGDALHQALAGDVYPVAQWPSDVPDPAMGVHFDGVESLFVGKASFYLCEYGRYIIAMNTSTDRGYRLTTQHLGRARDVATGERVSLPCSLDVRPLSTVVLYVE